MRARRALAIAITTPVLLVTIGMTGASAADESGEDEMRPEEVLVHGFAKQLVGHLSPAKPNKTEAGAEDF